MYELNISLDLLRFYGLLWFSFRRFTASAVASGFGNSPLMHTEGDFSYAAFTRENQGSQMTMQFGDWICFHDWCTRLNDAVSQPTLSAGRRNGAERLHSSRKRRAEGWSKTEPVQPINREKSCKRAGNKKSLETTGKMSSDGGQGIDKLRCLHKPWRK